MSQFLISTFIVLIFSFNSKPTANLTVKITGIEEAKGNMSIALFDNAESFPGTDNVYMGKKVAVTSKIFEYVFENLPHGTYAMAIFQDIDKSGDLSTNWIGYPTEPFAFSNNAMGKMGPPSFEDASFEVSKDHTITITLK